MFISRDGHVLIREKGGWSCVYHVLISREGRMVM